MLSKIVRTVASILVPLIFVFGLYIILHGQLTPGGGFQGGGIVASGLILYILAYNSRYLQQRFKDTYLSMLEYAGALIFIIAAFLGIASTFFYNVLVGSPIYGHIPVTGPNPGDYWTGGVQPIMYFGIGLKVFAGVSTALWLLAINSTPSEAKK